ncbi:UvrD-helicase domain-containing protein, partial [Actinoplanes sp. NPDC051633]|uniref:UvrD-helicase domain-containing protein n=1 Tax=Actinoplanes sp. NPDC051633 TaxID=3155670 RepID=UPI00343BEB3F
WDRAMCLFIWGNPTGEPPRLDEEEPADEPAAPSDPRLTAALDDAQTSPEFLPVPADDLEEVLKRPIEDWMVYLDPDQRSLVERNYNGPARIRGAAGTGKTVVALHRARRFAAEGKRVLFTTYVRNLPPIYEQVFARWAPSELKNVEFAGVHSWAMKYLVRHGAKPVLDLRGVDDAWNAAVKKVAGPGSPLAKAGLWPVFLHEEIDWVVRGRALPSPDAYLALERSGRGTPLNRELRAEVWKLSQAYEDELSRREISDFTEVLHWAYEVADDNPPEYDAVIVDEAQDLTDAALRLLHAVVGNKPNGLMLVGDGQQSIYPGGFSLASVGINVVGRSHVLTANYRNTREILQTAGLVVRNESFDDGGAAPEPGERGVAVNRSGPAPRVIAAPDEATHDVALLDAIEDAATSVADLGDIAVLVPTNAMVKDMVHLLNTRGLSAQHLKDHDGRPNQRPKVGTYQRAKGLEFKQVFVPRLDHAGRQVFHKDPEARAAYEAVVKRQLFVAMTRARDGLWLGWAGQPSPLVPPGIVDMAREPLLS